MNVEEDANWTEVGNFQIRESSSMLQNQNSNASESQAHSEASYFIQQVVTEAEYPKKSDKTQCGTVIAEELCTKEWRWERMPRRVSSALTVRRRGAEMIVGWMRRQWGNWGRIMPHCKSKKGKRGRSLGSVLRSQRKERKKNSFWLNCSNEARSTQLKSVE